AGTLKLDQAQYRELEAFSKFGSDLDAATKSVIDKGARNVEILKQKQFSPMTVEKQTAIIFLGTQGLIQSVPINKVKEFESDFLNMLEVKHKATLESIRKGVIDDAVTGVLKTVGAEAALRFKSK
ncbi:MAG: F0F1 ATP synthase subunit alpha, partial [Ignavibacteria bacterium]|nr:F0F1 ATP synthase subunit alpha [Ignavibacteria bacterium]